jgi:hypothetical protein
MPDWVHTFPGGLVAESMYISGDALRPVGSVYGFSAVSSGNAGLMVLYPRPNPGLLGSVQVTVALFMGDTGAIDMDRLAVAWSSGGPAEALQISSSVPLVCPNWTIVEKYHMLPGHTADADNLLEPGEQFLIQACPSQGIAPYLSFTLTLHPEGTAVPLPLTRMVPAQVQPVMDLG